ncbi:MAG: class I SAM-dependent methyltransferase [Chloroflexi bacterium]|nr:class I SAM-dependent methyltransferase [Chloroflexota bacterium]
MDIITRRGPQRMSQAEFTELRGRYSSTLVDLGTGDGAWPRRFAREHGNVLAIGIDADRDALRDAAKRAERKPARGGAPNALYVAASAESLPSELQGAADWITIYFPWAALLRMILDGDPALVVVLHHLSAPHARFSLVLNAEATPEGYSAPSPDSLRSALETPLASGQFRVATCDWIESSQAPATTWAGRLVKGSNRAILGLDALR